MLCTYCFLISFVCIWHLSQKKSPGSAQHSLVLVWKRENKGEREAPSERTCEGKKMQSMAKEVWYFTQVPGNDKGTSLQKKKEKKRGFRPRRSRSLLAVRGGHPNRRHTTSRSLFRNGAPALQVDRGLITWRKTYLKISKREKNQEPGFFFTKRGLNSVRFSNKNRVSAA